MKNRSLKNNLQKIQIELIVPKSEYNDFGGFPYRSAEKILERVKPLLKKYNATLRVNDEMVYIGERYYIKSTAEYIEGDFKESCTAYAREQETKKGMDQAQITGASSSYSRKYALQGLFLLDDPSQEIDSYNNQEQNLPKSNNLYNEMMDLINERLVTIKSLNNKSEVTFDMVAEYLNDIIPLKTKKWKEPPQNEFLIKKVMKRLNETGF